jgi:DNA-directed RNA polymerase specialized sigma24 family protein
MAADLEESFDTFVRARGEHFLRVAALLTGSPTEAEDLLQASLVRLYRAWPRLGVPESAPHAYLRKILVNTRRSWWRAKWRRESPVANVPASQVYNLGKAYIVVSPSGNVEPLPKFSP